MPIICDFWKRLLWYRQKSSVLWITNLGSQLSFLIFPHLLRIWAPSNNVHGIFLCNFWSWRQFIYLLYKDQWNWPKKQSNTFFLEKYAWTMRFWKHHCHILSRVFPVFFKGKVKHLKNSFFAHIDFKMAIFLSYFLWGTKFGHISF